MKTPQATLRLPPRQRQVLRLIYDHLRERGCPPTQTQLMLMLGNRSRNSVYLLLERMQRGGWLHRVKQKSRTIRLAGVVGFVSGMPQFECSARGARLAEAVLGRAAK